jgi:hypothetical protein
MIEYSSNKYGKWRRVDIESLWLGDNLASDMTQQRLYAELTDAGVPRITKGMGKPDLLFCLGVHQQELVEAKREAGATK